MSTHRLPPIETVNESPRGPFGTVAKLKIRGRFPFGDEGLTIRALRRASTVHKRRCSMAEEEKREVEKEGGEVVVPRWNGMASADRKGEKESERPDTSRHSGLPRNGARAEKGSPHLHGSSSSSI